MLLTLRQTNLLGTMDLDLDFDILEELEGTSRKYAKPLDKHLSSPITTTLLEKVQYYYDLAVSKYSIPNLSLRDRLSRIRAEDSNANIELMQPGLLPSILEFGEHVSREKKYIRILDAKEYPKLFNLKHRYTSHVEDDLELANYVYAQHLKAYMTYVSDLLRPREAKALEEKLMIRAKMSDPLRLVFYQAETWEYIVSRIRKARRSRTLGTIIPYGKNEACGVNLSRRLIVIRFGSKIRLCTYEQLQMVQDAVLSRANVQLMLSLGLHNGSPDLVHKVDELLRWQERVLKDYGNAGYEIIKAPEAIFKSRLTQMTEGDILDRSSFSRTYQKIMEKELSLDRTTPHSRWLYDFALSVSNCGDAVELFGLIKLSGHPTVYARNSGRSVQQEAKPRDRTYLPSMLGLLRNIKHIILSTYIQEHQEWPPFLVPPAENTALRRHMNNRVTALPEYCYSKYDLDAIKFDKFIEFDYSDDYLKFLDDKAICPGASETPKFWFGDGDRSKRRLLLHALKQKKIDTYALVERMRRGHTTRDEEVIELTQKEREFKVAARCFCKLPFEVRCFFTLTEMNLGEGVMKRYFPQQTMTMSHAEEKMRLHEMSKSEEGERNSAVIEIDFSRWNLRWRNLTVKYVAEVLEDIYGLPGVFSQAHDYFSRCTVVVTDSYNLPPGADPKVPIHSWPESDLLWRNHLGGFEGIQQKLWTICTIGMVYNAIGSLEEGIQFQMAGQGDNQVLVIRFPPATINHKDLVLKLLTALELHSQLLNHTVKPDECLDSYSVLTYSKEIYVRGVHMQYSLKFGARIFTLEDSDIPSLGSEISSACASSVAVAATLPRPFQGLWLQSFQAIRVFRSRLYICDSETERSLVSEFLNSKRALRFALSLPGSLGGLPIMSWGRYFMKGEVDDLSWDVASVVRQALFNKALRADFSSLLEGEYMSNNPDLSQLILDPSSIPIARPKDQKRLIKEAVESALPAMVVNSDILSILLNIPSSSGDPLLGDLAKVRPFYPKIMKDIWDASLGGLRDSIVGRFNMTRTISGVINPSVFSSKIEESNIGLLTFVKRRYIMSRKRFRGYNLFVDQTYRYCDKLRSFWLPKEKDPVIFGTTLCPLACTLTSNCIDNAIIAGLSRSPMGSLGSTLGGYSPNFGTKTRQKRTEHYKIITSSDTMRQLKLLSLIASESRGDDNFRALVSGIIGSRSPWTLEQLEPIMPCVYGGTMAHRHDGMIHNHFAVLGNLTIPTHLAFDTDHSGQLKGGEEDYSVVFQEFFLTITSIFQHLDSSGVLPLRPFSVGIKIPELVPLKAESLTMTSAPRPRPTGLIGNPLAYASALQVRNITRRPPIDIVPDAGDLDPVSLVASFFLSVTRIKTYDALHNMSTILKAGEEFDVAEYVGCSKKDLFEGASLYVAIEGVYHAAQPGTRGLTDRLRTSFLMCASAISGSLARLLMCDVAGSAYLRELGLDALPGFGGAHGLARKVAGKLVDLALIHARTHRTVLNRKFYIFGDTACMGVPLLRKISLFLILRSYSAGTDRHVLSAKARGMLRDSLFSVRDTTDHSETLYRHKYEMERLAKAMLQLPDSPGLPGLSVIRKEGRLVATEILNSYPNVVYVKADAKESLRFFRGRQPESLLLYSAPVAAIKWNAARSVKFVRASSIMGGIQFPESIERTKSEQFSSILRSHLYRPLGRYASAYSVWLPIMKRHSKLISQRAVLCVGVGRGATSAAALELGASNVFGLDLRSIIPAVPHRELSWKPPEVNCRPDRQNFSLVPEIFSMGGDWLEESSSVEICSRYDISTIIIDIESGGEVFTLPKLLHEATFNRTVICRTFLTEEQLKWTLSIIPDSFRVYCCGSSPAGSSLSEPYVFVGEVRGRLNHLGIPSAISDLRIPPLCSGIGRCQTTKRERVNDLLRSTGYVAKSADTAEIDAIAKSLLKFLRGSKYPYQIKLEAIRFIRFAICARIITHESPAEWYKMLDGEIATRQSIADAALYAANTIDMSKIDL